MIERLRLENFKGIVRGEIELAPLTILLGANNSGKTTILEALFLAPNPFRKVPFIVGGGDKAINVIGELHKTLESSGFLFLLYNYTSKEAKIECKTEKDEHILKLIREDDQIKTICAPKSEEKGVIGSLSTRDGSIFNYYAYTTTAGSINRTTGVDCPLMDNTLLLNPSLMVYAFNYLRMNWGSIVNLGICRNAAKDASKFSNEGYLDLTMEPFIGGTLSINVYREDGSRRRLGDLGNGIQNYIISKILYEITQPEVLLWDDVEAHFNPRILLDLSMWFLDLIERGRQVVLASHSLEAVEIIARQSEDKAKIYLTSIIDGRLKVREITLDEVEELRMAGIDVRTMEALLI